MLRNSKQTHIHEVVQRMTRRNLTTILAAAIAAVALAAPAVLAAPDRTATISAANPTFKWTGGPGSSFTTLNTNSASYPCDMPAHDCDYTLLNVTDPGTLKVKVSSSDPNTIDAQVVLYLSDASGMKGKQLQAADSSTPTPNEALAAEIDAGYYLVEFDYEDAVLGNYAGEATLVPGEAAPPEAGPAPPAAANAAPKPLIGSPKSKKVSRKKLKGFSGTASDDKGVSKIEVALFQTKGSKCKALTAKGTFKSAPCDTPLYLAAKGTTKWSFKLKKKVPKGKYLLVARATDTDGATDTAKAVFTAK
jgi:hypothetical protein